MDVADLLARPVAMVPADVVNDAGVTAVDVREYLEHDEWEVALDLLADLDMGWRPPTAWWDLLIDSAELMWLSETAARAAGAGERASTVKGEPVRPTRKHRRSLTSAARILAGPPRRARGASPAHRRTCPSLTTVKRYRPKRSGKGSAITAEAAQLPLTEPVPA
ncbi:hypothetical protein ACX27O_25495 [Micromonospora sp. SD19]